ncbi:hypothetical protein JCM3774_004063 [Rhodotorula dairenensis]
MSGTATASPHSPPTHRDGPPRDPDGQQTLADTTTATVSAPSAAAGDPDAHSQEGDESAGGAQSPPTTGAPEPPSPAAAAAPDPPSSTTATAPTLSSEAEATAAVLPAIPQPLPEPTWPPSSHASGPASISPAAAPPDPPIASTLHTPQVPAFPPPPPSLPAPAPTIESAASLAAPPPAATSAAAMVPGSPLPVPPLTSTPSLNPTATPTPVSTANTAPTATPSTETQTTHADPAPAPASASAPAPAPDIEPDPFSLPFSEAYRAVRAASKWNSLLGWARKVRLESSPGGAERGWDFGTGMYHVPRNSPAYTAGVKRLSDEAIASFETPVPPLSLHAGKGGPGSAAGTVLLYSQNPDVLNGSDDENGGDPGGGGGIERLTESGRPKRSRAAMTRG